MSRRTFWLGIAIGVLAACSPDSSTSRTTTQRSRDSAIGASKLPGAQGVRGALRASDSAVSRNAQLDSVANQR